MSKFTFYGDSKYFNPNCTSDLLFDNLDGSGKRIFCVESTCVDSKYSGNTYPGPCWNSMVPTPSTGESFVWGVDGGPWTPNINYGEIFPYSPNEFVANGARFATPRPIAQTGCEWIYDKGRMRFPTTTEGAYFSSTWAIQDTTYAGYQAMSSADLNSPIDVGGVMGTVVYDPKNALSGGFGVPGCSVYRSVVEPVVSGIYNVGSDPIIPESHDVTFSDVLITLASEYTVHNYGTVSDEQFVIERDYYNNYIAPGLVPSACHGMAYSLGNHPGPDTTALIASWSYSLAGGGLLRSARSYFPTLDTDTAGIYQKGIRMDTQFITGYKMQKFVQRKHWISFGVNGASIQTGLSHTETRIGVLGYRAKWVFKSVVPKNVYPSISSFTGSSRTYRFEAKAEITVTVSYEKISTSLPKSTDPLTSATHYLITPSSYPGGSLPGYMTTHSSNAPAGQNLPTNASKTLYYTYPLNWRSSPATLTFLFSGYNTPVIDPPGINYICYGAQRFTKYGVVHYPNGLSYSSNLPLTPNDFKIWRRKVSNSTIAQGGDSSLGFSNRTEWFNGTCPFDIKFDRNLSDNTYFSNMCSSTLVPYLEPTG